MDLYKDAEGNIKLAVHSNAITLADIDENIEKTRLELEDLNKMRREYEVLYAEVHPNTMAEPTSAEVVENILNTPQPEPAAEPEPAPEPAPVADAPAPEAPVVEAPAPAPEAEAEQPSIVVQ